MDINLLGLCRIGLLCRGIHSSSGTKPHRSFCLHFQYIGHTLCFCLSKLIFLKGDRSKIGRLTIFIIYGTRELVYKALVISLLTNTRFAIF